MKTGFGPDSPERLAELRRLGAAQRNLRTEVLRAVKEGRLTVGRAFMEHPELLDATKVGRLIKSVPGWGPRRTHLLLSDLGVEPERSVRALGPKQRARLLAAITQ